MIIHIFGKSEGCAKCHVLRTRVKQELEKERYKGRFDVVFHDLLTEEGLAVFCTANINPNRVPALVIGDGKEYLRSAESSDRSRLFPYLGICTDYGDQHNGTITAEMIDDILKEALEY